MVTLTLWRTWELTIGDDLRVACSRRSVRQWAQAMIDSHEPPTDYIPDLSVYHAHRLAEFPGWRIKRVDSEAMVKGRVY